MSTAARTRLAALGLAVSLPLLTLGACDSSVGPDRVSGDPDPTRAASLFADEEATRPTAAAPASGGPSSDAPDSAQTTEPTSPQAAPDAKPTDEPSAEPRTELPGGGTEVFRHHQFLVAYYGTANTGSLGVLGESDPDEMDRRLTAAAAPFGGTRRRVQHVYELIATVVDPIAGADGSYSHDINRDDVKRYIAAAHRNQALLVLDLQPGRSDFLTVVKRWAWALKDPWVGLALDPEWRMGPGEIPARVVGHVRADEVNQTSAWLDDLTRRNNLPEKIFLLHQFRTSMIIDIDRVEKRKHLAEVQHVDGFGTREQKLATYHAVAKPDEFTMGFKLFYDEDIDRMGPPQVHRIRPTVRFVSFQ